MSRVMEIRSYQLKAGMRPAFHQLVETEAIPMLQRWKLDVVDYGPSLQDTDEYYLMRSFADLTDLQQQEDAFYASEEWINGPRAGILSMIEKYVSVVIPVDDTTLAGLRSKQKNLA
jgi:hypothetical protein